MFRTLIQWSAMILTLEASYFLIKGNLSLSPKIIAKLSLQYCDSRDETLKSLSVESADTRVGFIILLASFVLQMGNSLWPLRWKEFGVDRYGVLIAIGGCTVILAAAKWYSRLLSRGFYNKSLQLVKSMLEQQS